MVVSNSSSNIKKVDKENAPPLRSTKTHKEEEAQGDKMGAEDDVPKKSKPVSKSGAKALQSAEHDTGSDDVRELKKKLASVTADRDRYRTQRDNYSKQFEELAKNRSESEGLFEKYKEKAELQAKAQNDIIASQTALTEKLQAKVHALEKAANTKDGLPSAGGVFDGGSSKADPKEVKALKEELARIRAESKEKDEKIAQVQREYKAEVAHSQSLQASTRGTSVPVQSTSAVVPSSDESAKDAKSLALYEDLTMLTIANVKIKPGRAGDETMFNCILSVDGQSLNFKLRSYTEIDKTQKNPYIKTVHYIPELLQHESASFVTKLDYFASEFVVPREQLGGLYMELRSKMGVDEED